jgi:CubicO group peptidase (beta-lactamase class C family)
LRISKYIIVTSLLVAATAGVLPAQAVLQYGTPAEAGMSEEALKAGVSFFAEATARDDLRGAVLLVARNGRVVLHEAVGLRSKEENLPMQKDTLFRMASNTKPVIATAVMILAEAGKLRLDDNVRQHLPSFDNYRAGYIKIRHLLTHTSGLRIPTIFLMPLMEKSAEHPDAPSLLLEASRIGAIGSDEVPGTTYSYSNAGFNTLGAIVEIASGQPLELFLKQRIYEPLGMSDSCNHESKAPAQRMASVYDRREGQWTRRWKPGDPPDYPFVRASGGMVSTAWDYAKFCLMFLNGGTYDGKKVLKPESVEAATSPQTQWLYKEEQRRTMTSFYGFGWSVSLNGVYSHGGSDGTFAWIDPARKVIGLVFTQSPGGRIPVQQFMKVVEASVTDSRP